ncbi:helix-turn-helix domain-containing protein [Candidatus Gottesmanbacteria bacterium]|nr:helix-turn-helix domain-containing protein [Candidatus Gottesmanbacteria bacterium]
MKTVGSILKEARIGKEITLEQVEKATKIREKFLHAIEADDYTTLPSPSYAKGFVKNYSAFLGLDIEWVLAFFRRQTREPPRSTLLPKQQDELEKPFFRLTPNRFLLLFVASLVLIFLSYLGLQYRKLTSPPFLSIESPKEQIVKDKRVDILGKTDTDATVTINDVSVFVRSDGRFFDQRILNEGINKIVITSTSRYGKTTTATREVTYKP